MPATIDNKGVTTNIDNNMAALDDISLDSIQNPQEPDTNIPPIMGDAGKTAEELALAEEAKKKALIQQQVVPPANEDKTDEDNDAPAITIKTTEDLINIVKNKTADTLTDEESEELLSIVDAFGGEAFNSDGAIIDADGNILYTVEQVSAYLETNELPVDEEGNFVDATGNVIKTKSELFREQTTVGVVMNALAKNFDVSFNDTFQPEDTEESIVDVVVRVAKVLNQTAVQEYMTANPEIEAFRKYLLLHGTGEGYKTNSVDYDKLDLKTLSKESKKAIIVEAFSSTGQQLTDRYSKYLDTLEEEDFNAEVLANTGVLKEQQKQKQTKINEQLKAREDAEQATTEKYWATVTNTIKNGKLSNINIPVTEREAFLSYVLTPVANGKSKDMLDAEKEDVTSDLLMSYLRYKGNDISALARNIAQTQKVQGLRERMAKNNTRNNNSGKGIKPKTQDNYIPHLGEIQF